MTSRLVRNLEATIRSTSDAMIWARSMCRLALHFSRQGEEAKAVEAIVTVRAKFKGSIGPEVAAWLMLAEGVLNFSKGDLGSSADRLKRSYAIAAAANIIPTKALCAAWLAHMTLNTRRFNEMVSYLGEALTLARADDHHARSRASLVLADAFHYAGRFDLARPWYEKARLHAVAEGDEAAVSAMLHNVAAFRTANVKLADAIGTGMPEEAKRASMEATSAAAYDRAIGTKSFNAFIPHVNEQLLLAGGKYEEALAQLSKIDVAGLPTRVHAVHYVDHATCAMETGDIDLAIRLRDSALNALERFQLDPDDIAYVCWRLVSIYSKRGAPFDVERFKARAIDAMDRHRALQADINAKLGELVQSLPT
jgi:tetratricopeptide (TPR) repeat protein